MVRREDIAEVPHPTNSRRRIVVSHERWRVGDLRRIARPPQSKFTWFLLVLEGRKEIGRCGIRSWTGSFDGVSPSPDGSLAAVRWNDQTEAGLVLVELTEQPRQLAAGWDTRKTNWLEGPTWTPDSQLLVLFENPAGAGPWWAEQTPGVADDDDVSPGGTFTPGSVVVLDRDLQERFREQITVELATGWFPNSDADRGLSAPAIIQPSEVRVRVPGEGDRRIAIRSC